jgi:hypothetical protein
MVERTHEVVMDNGNTNSRFTITPTRVTVKVCDTDKEKESDLIMLSEIVASQVKPDVKSLRGTVRMDKDYFTLSTKKKHHPTFYKFETSTGKLVEIRND